MVVFNRNEKNVILKEEGSSMTNIVSVIEKLSERFQSENDISDITYSLLRADDDFNKTFLNAIFPDIKNEEVLYIQRELPEVDSRPDFIIETTKNKYLIEVKKWDKNQHFDQYIRAFPDYKRAYITNYELGSGKTKYKKDYCFFTWKEIYDTLLRVNEIKKNEVIEGYLKYLKKVCGFMEIKDMRFDNLHNLAQFNSTVKEIISTQYDNLICTPYDTKYNFSMIYSGSYFSLRTEKGKKVIYPWFGVQYGDDDTKISIFMEFNKGWCSLLKDKRNEICTNVKRNNDTTCSVDNNGIYVSLDETAFQKLEKESDVTKQTEILTSFFENTICVLEKYLE